MEHETITYDNTPNLMNYKCTNSLQLCSTITECEVFIISDVYFQYRKDKVQDLVPVDVGKTQE